jgi:hypothetical protein
MVQGVRQRTPISETFHFAHSVILVAASGAVTGVID